MIDDVSYLTTVYVAYVGRSRSSFPSDASLGRPTETPAVHRSGSHGQNGGRDASTIASNVAFNLA